MASITPQQLLSEVEDLLRTMPPRATIRHPATDNYAWLGRASALVSEWSKVKAITFDGFVSTIHSDRIGADQAFSGMLTMLHQARHELRLKTVGPLSVVLPQGAVFDYFDELRRVVESASTDLLFVDPYLDAEFVSRYLPNIAGGVSIRLLGRQSLATLLPAVQLLRQQSGAQIEVRTSLSLHDRFLFVDKTMCYQSGASFKDGAKKSSTTLTQVTDAFPAIQTTYEALWMSGQIHP
jgi:hypothetical protein